MYIKITLQKDEVEKVIKDYVLTILPINRDNVVVYTHESFGEYIVEIDPNPKMEAECQP